MSQVADPWGGSYMMETLTNELANEAMIIINEVEELGGMTRAIESGMAKLRIEECATKKQARIDSRMETVVGVNKYQVELGEEVPVLEIDNTRVRSQQIAQLEVIRASRDSSAVEVALEKLRESARDNEGNLVQLSVEAARLRCTVGEISDALRDVWGAHRPTSPVVQGAYASTYKEATDYAEFELVKEKMSEFALREGRQPRILVAKMGQDGHDRGAKVIASGFADLGFDVDIGPLFQTPEEVALQAIDSDVHVVGISSQAAGHKALVPPLIEILNARGAGHMIVVCGGVIPPQDHDFLLKHGVAAIFGPGSRIVEAALKVLNEISLK